jgi:adenine-specific DNA-methyltransferase
MPKISCEKCGKEFNSKSHYTQHQNRKTPCVNENKIKELIDKTVEEKLTKLNVANASLLVNSFENNIPTAHTAVSNQLLVNKTVETATFQELQKYYDETLNTDKSTYKSSNDEPTPIDCVNEMIRHLPTELWSRSDLSILDPCCGNGNFSIPILFELLKHHDKRTILEEILEFNDINDERLENVRKVFCGEIYKLQITNNNFISPDDPICKNPKKYDLIVANPPYAKLLENGKRASKNHNLIKDFIEKTLTKLKPDGYLLFITPDNWMSYADRNVLIEIITRLQIIHLDIHSAKKYFKKIGSSFTWYIIQNRESYKNINVSGIWKKNVYTSSVVSMPRKYIPLLYNQTVQDILLKTVDNTLLAKFEVKTSSDLHKYTKAALISDVPTENHTYKLIHTPNQTVYASRPHKYQEGYKVFISTTDRYKVFIDTCGMTQSIVFILCSNEQQAKKYLQILQHPLYIFINNICRWGNFNNIRILQSFPIPVINGNMNSNMNNDMNSNMYGDIFNYFKITEAEQEYINANL